MKKRYFFLLISLLLSLHSFSQIYILNEDFSGASGTTPPNEWTIDVISGSADDTWHFDNPGERTLNFPITDPFAIFDSDSTSANGIPEEVALETPSFDASISNYILLQFDQVFYPGAGGLAKIEAYDGDNWQEVITYSSATPNPSSEIVDLSAITGGITNAMLRFIWSGNGSGYWAIDNIRIYASLPLDGGVVSLDSPGSPVVPGLQNIEISFGNFGYNTITSTTIEWTANGTVQPQFNWNGSIGFGQTVSDVVIGTYNFQDPVVLKIWHTNPNGQPDPNPYNDTVTRNLNVALCGTYTIGGSNPDFATFSEVAEVLNAAGITCPVTFLVRDGIYYERFMLGNIQGTSEENTITFRSESGDSTQAIIQIDPGALKYESMISLDGSQHITFQGLGLFTGSTVSFANYAILMEGAKNITLTGCYLEVQNRFDFGIVIQEGSQEVMVRQNSFDCINLRAGAITVSGEQTRAIDIQENSIKGATDWGFTTIRIENNASAINVTGNHIERCYRPVFVVNSDSVRIRDNVIENTDNGVHVKDWSSNIEISGNRLTNIRSHQNEPDGTNGILVDNSSEIDIFNNFIHTAGEGPVMGINLQNATLCRACFNSINIANDDAQGKSKGIYLTECSEIIARNNIFNILHTGTPVYISADSPQLDFDRNDYYSFDQTIGYYNGNRYIDLLTWADSLGMDMNSLSVKPFYTSLTDLSINQSLLNNAGIPVAGIEHDIDGTLRNPDHPDIGAREYNPCAIDAGVNKIISPENPLTGGTEDVVVLLQNQGTNMLTSVQINWLVNEEIQPPYSWSGNLAAVANTEVIIGSYDFQPGKLYTLHVWTTEPNNTTDCNHYNDSLSSPELAAPLCGTYTIGGNSPDFSSVTEAATVINVAGITCPVTFLIRDGTYYEQFILGKIQGSSEENTITFRSESGDSTQAVIRINTGALNYESMIYLDGSQHITFQKLGLFTGSAASNYNYAILMEGAMNIGLEGCYFEAQNESDFGLMIQGGSQAVEVKQNRFESLNSRAGAIIVSGEQTRAVDIHGNSIKGATEWGFTTIKIEDNVRKINVTGNHIERCHRSIYVVSSDSVRIRDNVIENADNGVHINDWCTHIEISGNRLTNIHSHQDAPDGTSAIHVHNSTEINIFNNFIHTAGEGPVMGIYLQKTTFCRVNFNSINITNNDNQGKSKGIYLSESSDITARNNIFNLLHAGTPVYISAYYLQLDFDRNDYYSFDQTIGYYNGNRYTNLLTWADSLDIDMNSLSVKPFYTSQTNLSINQALLNNAGVTVAGIGYDIDGTLRDPDHPDIGAREYNPCANDAGINAITSPGNPLYGGMEEIKVLLQNQGTDVLTSVKINWFVNDEPQTPYSWSGNLAQGANATVKIGEYDFHSGKLYTLHVWTTEPNNTTDCNPHNDSLSSPELAAPLCGTYTIGGNSPDFNTVTEAATVLNLSGVTCPVTFLIRDGIYYEQFILGKIPGSSEENTITFRSVSGDSTQAVIQIAPGALKYESMIHLDGSQYIIFQGLGLFTGSDVGDANNAVLMEGAMNISMKGCYFETRNGSDYGLVIEGGSQFVEITQNSFECIHQRSSAITISGAQTRAIDILGNRIKGATSWGFTLIRIENSVREINMTGNHIEQCYRSVLVTNSDSVRILDNVINNVHYGIYVDNWCSYIEISGNRLTNVQSHQNAPEGTSGILVSKTTEIDIVNNFIHTAGEGPGKGISLQDAAFCRTYFNSINITNDDNQGKCKGIHLTEISDFIARDNIFNINNEGIPIYFDQNVSNISLDYNNYYNPAGIIGVINGQVYSNLFEWGQTINGDANSMAVNPYFEVDTLPFPYQRALNGAGIPVAGILHDIDGKIRNDQAPDMGCLEFLVDLGITELISPTLDCSHVAIDSVIVLICQFGHVPFEDMELAYQLNNGEIYYETIPGTIYTHITHTFNTTVNISANGEYFFKIWFVNNLDDNINNDTLKEMRYSKPSPEVSIEYNNFCTGAEVYFYGHADVVAPYYIDKYEWLFGDGETSDEQDPVHTYQAPGTYEVILRAYSDAGCYSQTIEPVYIDPDFQGLGMELNIENETCLGDGTGSLEIIASGGYPPYNYFINGEQVAGNLVSNFTSGQYEIRVVDSENCIYIDSIETFPAVYMNPHIQADPLSGNTPLTVSFDFTATNYAKSWTWYFGDSETDTNKATAHTFEEYGTHEIILEVYSGPPYHCTETDTVVIFVDIIVTIEANSVFTPNGDGYNDFFEIKSVGINEMNVNIFSQWGNKVYEIEQVDGKWDGNRKSGAKAPDGTYFYELRAKGFDNQVYNRQGSVLLLRHASEAFPNPVENNVKIMVYDQLQGPAYISVYSVFGQLVQSGSIVDTENIIINISPLKSGIYIIKVSDDNRNYFVRIIKI